MKLKNIFEVILGLGLLIVIGVVIYVVVTNLEFESDSTLRQAGFEQYHAAAEIYKRRMFDYQGVCGELVLAKGVKCDDNETGYRVYAQTENKQWYCTDATNFRGAVDSIKNGSLTCH